MANIKIGIAGVGNCASALVQGLEYYRIHRNAAAAGLMHPLVGDYGPTDIEVVAAFDIDRRKVGLPLEQAIFAKPNCTTMFQQALPVSNVRVLMAPVLDGIADHMGDYADDRAFRVAEAPPVDVAAVLKASGAQVLLCYLPVGSEQAVRHYAEACLQAKVAMVNCVPVFIASDPAWAARFREAGVPIVGDDIKSQVGATIVHRMLGRLFSDRGVALDRTYQLNTGGNTDFLNMLQRSRLASKKQSKTQSVQSQLDTPLDSDRIHIGPSDYVPWQNDNKVAFIRMEGRGFGDVPMNLELRLSVEDSPNSAGVVIDALRCAKLALDRGIGGPLEGPSAYYMKSPPVQVRDHVAREATDAFIAGKSPSLGHVRPPSPAVAVAGTKRVKTVLVLAAGVGSRLFPNASLPKPLAPVAGATMAEWVVRTLKTSIGAERFVVSVGHEADMVKAHFESIARRNGVRVSFVTAEDWADGNGASTLAAAEAMGDEPFVLTMCDHLYDASLPARLVQASLPAGGMRLAVDMAKQQIFDVDDATKVAVDGDAIRHIGKVLADWDGADTGVMYCTAGLFDALRQASADGEHGLSDGLRRLAAAGKAMTVDVTGSWWLDVDTPEAMRLAELFLAEPTRSAG
ncbi:MAG: NTP transferase domain-containing protein [Rhodospirillaceae bacterium]|nr:NTP transferase domain-containing protein [Rhodospirillaceae bacterium]